MHTAFRFGDVQIFRIVETDDAGGIIQRIVPSMTADTGTLLFPGHTPYPLRIRRTADGFTAEAVSKTDLLKGDDDAK